MAFFRFPYTSFNQINLDWIMKTLKKLEPAATLVEEAAATLEEAQQTAAEAQETAELAQETVSTVTVQAAAAVATVAAPLLFKAMMPALRQTLDKGLRAS